jgi:hypothetical protein
MKMLGYMVYFDMKVVLENTSEEAKFLKKVHQMVFEFAGDGNLNVQIRNSWTHANLSFIHKALPSDDEYLMQERLIISVNYSLSSKEKVSSNGLRALGYLLQQVDVQVLEQKTLATLRKSPQQLHRLSLSLGPRPLTLDTLILIIQESLDSKSPKIAWNSCVALANILANKSLTGAEVLFSNQSVRPLLKALEQNSNFKTKIHAATTLEKFTQHIHTFEEDSLYVNTWVALVNTLEQHNKAVFTS